MTAVTAMRTLGIHLPGGWEWIVIIIVVLLLFGHRLPGLGKSLGKGIVEFKKGLKGAKRELDEIDREVDEAAGEDGEPRKLGESRSDRHDGDAIGERTKDKDKDKV